MNDEQTILNIIIITWVTYWFVTIWAINREYKKMRNRYQKEILGDKDEG